jgi:hypothetical protein
MILMQINNLKAMNKVEEPKSLKNHIKKIIIKVKQLQCSSL